MFGVRMMWLADTFLVEHANYCAHHGGVIAGLRTTVFLTFAQSSLLAKQIEMWPRNASCEVK
jgi:hypothetical protein